MPDYARNLIPDRDGLVDDRRRIARVSDLFVDERLDREIRHPVTDPGALTRVLDTDPEDAARRLEEWLHGGHETVAISAPGGVRAWERTRRDTRPRTPAGPSLRRQRIALVVGEETASVAYWSAPEPPGPDDELPWRRALSHLVGEPSHEGWVA